MGIIQMSLTAGVLIIAIVIIRSLALNKLPKSFFLVLWGVAVCRLLISFEIPSIFSIFNMFKIAGSALQPAVDTPTIQGMINANIIDAVPKTIPSLEKAISLSPLGIIWLIGVVSIATIFSIAYYKNCTELKTALPIKNNPMLEQWHCKQRLLRPFNILVSDKITTPIALGIMQPRIILPKSMSLDDEQLVQYVLTHELQHIKHFDMFWKTVLLVVVCLHWFNPLVWTMYILANRDLELACDENVVRRFGEAAKTSYALSLISMAEQRSKFTPLYNGFSMNSAEERIISIMKYKKTSVIALALSFVLIVSITTSFATSAATEKNEESVFLAEASNIQDAYDLSGSTSSGNIYISRIAPSEAVCIAKLVLDTDTSYAIGVTTESGTAIFSALQEEYIEVTRTSGNWLHSFWTTSSGDSPYINTIPNPDLQWNSETIDGIYYLYVGSNGDELIDVNISVIGSGLGAKIEFLR